jgi:hypothetical protein
MSKGHLLYQLMIRVGVRHLYSKPLKHPCVKVVQSSVGIEFTQSAHKYIDSALPLRPERIKCELLK